MAATTPTNIVEALKYTYGVDRVLYLASQEVVLWNMLKRKTVDLGGRGQFIMPIQPKNAGSWHGVTPGGSIQTEITPDTAEASWSLQEFAGTYAVTWKLMQDARKSEFAFATAIKFHEDSFRRRILRLINADLLGYGRGELGILPAADNDTVVTVRALPLVDVGMVVDVMDASDDNTKLGDSRNVTAVDVDNRTITIDGAALTGTAATDYFTIQDTVATAYSYHMNGLLAVLDDDNPASAVGNIGSINRSTAGNEYWKAIVKANGGTNRALTEDLLLQAENSVRERGGAKLNAYLSNLAIGRRYHEILRADTFFSMGRVGPLGGGVGVQGGGSQAQGDSGKSPYEFSGVSWYFDPFFDANRVVGMDTSHFFIGVGASEVPRPASELFNGVPAHRVSGSTASNVDWWWQAELITDNPQAGFKIEDVAES